MFNLFNPEDPLIDSIGIPEDHPLRTAISDAAERLASGLEYRIEHLAEKEKRVRNNASWDTLPNMPARLVWEAFEPDAAAFFVVYKLIHEARSELPKVYRGIAWSLCAAQPKRFGFVSYREQLWDALAAIDCWAEDFPEPPSTQQVRDLVLNKIKERGKTDWWSCREADQVRESIWITEHLIENGGVRKALRNLQRLQVLGTTAFTVGNVICRIPKRLETLIESICTQASKGLLPPMEEIESRLAEIADDVAESGQPEVSHNQSIPFDLLTQEADGKLRVIALTRQKIERPKKEDLRRRLLYLRFFAHYAFGRRSPENLSVALAFYADKSDDFSEWLPSKGPMFHRAELWGFDQFWDYVADESNGGKLVEEITSQAAKKLFSQDLTAKLRSFLNGESETASTSSPARLLQAYLNTSYSVVASGKIINLRVGVHNPEFDQMLVQYNVNSWACITASNPGSMRLPEEKNKVRHDDLLREVKEAGYSFLEGYGRGLDANWPAEKSLFIFGIGRDEARRIGRRFGQNAILVGQLGHAPELNLLNGIELGK